jgi:hypothetical protein
MLVSHYAEERYTWVIELAGVRVGEITGSCRSCGVVGGEGCLNFLDGVSTNTPAATAEV